MKKIIWLVVTFLLVIPTVKGEEKNLLAPSAKSAILIEVSTGEVLYEFNSHEKLAPASMTKMMSLVLIMEALENGSLKETDMITASKNASDMGGSQILLEEGEKMSVDDLLKGITIASGNDAVVAMAEAIGGSEANFVNMMNKIINEEKHNRNKEEVAIERICDTAGKIKFEVLKNKLDDILKSYNIDKNEFIENMYNLRLMRYVSPLMKSLNDINLTIKVYAELLNLISYIEGKEKLKVYTIYFMPKAHESKFVEEIKNNNFFVAIDKMKSENIKFAEIGKIQIEINSEKETVFISINSSKRMVFYLYYKKDEGIYI